MADPMTSDATLGTRLAAAGATAERQTEVGIQRARGWCLVIALVQTALYPGDHWYLAWGAMAVLTLSWGWVRWALQPRATGPRVRVVGVVAMASDTLAVIMIMANLMATPDDPVQLLPLALAVEAAVRWGRTGGLAGGVAGGLLMTGWSVATHRRNDLDLSVGYALFRFGVLVLLSAIVGNAVREMRQQRRAAEAVFQASRDLMATFASDGRLLAVNPACESILGYTPEELLAEHGELLLGRDERSGAPPIDLAGAEAPRRIVRRLQHHDGETVWIELDLVPDPRSGLVYVIGRDVSDRSRKESELRHRVDHDGLSGTWNRHALVAYLHRMLTRGYFPALVFVDLDRFKAINDLHGHVVGDAVIVELAERLGAAAAHDGTVARYAGDEFCIVVDDPDDLEAVADRARASFASPFRAGRDELVVTASIGCARSRPGDTAEVLVHRADQAMYEQKRAGTLPL